MAATQDIPLQQFVAFESLRILINELIGYPVSQRSMPVKFAAVPAEHMDADFKWDCQAHDSRLNVWLRATRIKDILRVAIAIQKEVGPNQLGPVRKFGVDLFIEPEDFEGLGNNDFASRYLLPASISMANNLREGTWQ